MRGIPGEKPLPHGLISAQEQGNRKMFEHVTNGYMVVARDNFASENIRPFGRSNARHDDSGVLPNLTAQRKATFLNQRDKEAGCDGHHPFPIILPVKSDDVIP